MDHFSGHQSQIALKEGKRPVPPPSEISVKAGSLLFKEGDSSRDVYIVKEGSLSISQRRGSIQVELARLQDRAVFGEMSLLDNQPRSATVRAITDCKLTVIAPVTFQGMLRLVPAWLLAVLKVVTHRLRETNRKINQHTVPDTMESLCVFLGRKCTVFSLNNKSTPAFPWFDFVDEYCLYTRQKREEVQKCAHTLATRGMISINNTQELVVPDPQLLEILRLAISLERRKEPFPTQNLDPLVTFSLDAIPKLPSESFKSKELVVLELQKMVDSRIGMSHVQKLFELEILTCNAEGVVSLDKTRLTWVKKAIQDFDRITGKFEVAR